MDRAGRFRRDVTRDSARKRELFEQLPHPRGVLADVRIKFGVGAFQISVGDQSGTAMSGPGDVDRVQIVLFDKRFK